MRIAFIGASGHTSYAVSPASRHNEWELVGVAPGSKDETVTGLYNELKAISDKVRYYDDWRELIEVEKPNVVVNDAICGYMAEINIECLKHGISVFCEKPMATTHDELDRIEEAWRNGGGELTAMLNYRYEKPFVAAYEAVQAGRIGEVRHINAQKSYKLGTRAPYYSNRALYGGTIPWVGSHAFDWIRWFSAKPFKNIAAFHTAANNGGNGSCEAGAVCAIEMESDILATATIDYRRPSVAPTHADDRLRVVGDLGYIDIKDNIATLVTDKPEVLETADTRDMFTDFILQIEHKGESRLSAEEALEIMHAVITARDYADTAREFDL